MICTRTQAKLFLQGNEDEMFRSFFKEDTKPRIDDHIGDNEYEIRRRWIVFPQFH